MCLFRVKIHSVDRPSSLHRGRPTAHDKVPPLPSRRPEKSVDPKAAHNNRGTPCSMQSINWFQLFMVMWLNIQVASSEFICNDNGTPARVAAKVGFCARPIIPAERVNQRLDPSATFWVYQASPGRGRSFTCDGVSIASHPTTSRFCCKLNKLPYLIIRSQINPFIVLEN
ncbi:hypothetical protein KEM48_001252 [Puccinia striiformis f. sp. tritici PST-130]|nr:hypothetical protein H4Q26_000446 [Puccinia striiformis f. sp. tritici PST-130]KAI9601963.1 hypothetical protein KEM48_001252 [Puccinia striiformis f. sp. tritici PST-130]